MSKQSTPKRPASKTVAEKSPKIDAKQTQVDLLLAIAENHETHGNLPAAVKAYEEVLKKGKYPTASHRLALVSFKLGDQEKAWELLNQCMKQSPKDAELIADCAYLKQLSGELEEAERLTRKGLEINPASARLHNNLGLILVELDRSDEAFKEFTLAGCSSSEAYSNLGHAYLGTTQSEKGEHFLNIAATSPRPCEKAMATLNGLSSKRVSLAAK